MANSNAIRQQVAHTITTYHQLSKCLTRAIKKKKLISHYFHEKYWKNRKRESNEGSEIEGRRMTWHTHPPFRGVRWNDPLKVVPQQVFQWQWENKWKLASLLGSCIELFYCNCYKLCWFYFLFVCVLVFVCLCVMCVCMSVHVKDVTSLVFLESLVMNAHIFQQLNKIQSPVWNQSDRTVEVQLLLFQVHTSITAGNSI